MTDNKTYEKIAEETLNCFRCGATYHIEDKNEFIKRFAAALERQYIEGWNDALDKIATDAENHIFGSEYIRSLKKEPK